MPFSIFRQLFTSAHIFKFDYYKILGVKKNATTDDIKKAYLKKSKQYHPDKHMGNKKMQEKFVEANEAYTVLSDADKKKEYDSELNNKFNNNFMKNQQQQSKDNSYSNARTQYSSAKTDYEMFKSRWNDSLNQKSTETSMHQHQSFSRHSFRTNQWKNKNHPLYQYWQQIYQNDYSGSRSSPFSYKVTIRSVFKNMELFFIFCCSLIFCMCLMYFAWTTIINVPSSNKTSEKLDLTKNASDVR